MIQDKHNLFSDAQALTDGAAASTDVINFLEAKNLFEGEPMVVVVNVLVAAKTSDADETYQFDVQTDELSAFGSPATLASRTIARATLVAGYQFTLPVPVEAEVEEHMRLYYTLGGTLPTITVTAALMPQSMVPKYRVYPDNSQIS